MICLCYNNPNLQIPIRIYEYPNLQMDLWSIFCTKNCHILYLNVLNLALGVLANFRENRLHPKRILNGGGKRIKICSIRIFVDWD
jgi:hypothetical protein